MQFQFHIHLYILTVIHQYIQQQLPTSCCPSSTVALQILKWRSTTSKQPVRLQAVMYKFCMTPFSLPVVCSQILYNFRYSRIIRAMLANYKEFFIKFYGILQLTGSHFSTLQAAQNLHAFNMGRIIVSLLSQTPLWSHRKLWKKQTKHLFGRENSSCMS